MRILVHQLGSFGRTQLPKNALVKSVAQSVLIHNRIKRKGELNIIFVDNKIIKRLHRAYLMNNTVTDVLAFPYHGAVPKKDLPPFGDIFISIPVAEMNARRYRQPVSLEILRLVIHGLLHLLGYRDDKHRLKKRMWSTQEDLLKKICSTTKIS